MIFIVNLFYLVVGNRAVQVDGPTNKPRTRNCWQVCATLSIVKYYNILWRMKIDIFIVINYALRTLDVAALFLIDIGSTQKVFHHVDYQSLCSIFVIFEFESVDELKPCQETLSFQSSQQSDGDKRPAHAGVSDVPRAYGWKAGIRRLPCPRFIDGGGGPSVRSSGNLAFQQPFWSSLPLLWSSSKKFTIYKWKYRILFKIYNYLAYRDVPDFKFDYLANCCEHYSVIWPFFCYQVIQNCAIFTEYSEYLSVIQQIIGNILWAPDKYSFCLSLVLQNTSLFVISWPNNEY